MQIKEFMQKVTHFSGNEDGVTAIEYALLAALIFAVIVIAVTAVGTNVSALFASVAGLIP